MSAPILSLRDLEDYDPRPSRHGRETRFCCPLPGLCARKSINKAHQSLTVNTETGVWHCWRCGAKGKLAEFREEWHPPTQRERQRTAIRKAFALPPPTSTSAITDPSWRGQMRGVRLLTGTSGARYLVSRGIEPELAQDAGARFLADWFGRPAVLFPLRDAKGGLVGAHGRYTDGRDDPKSRTYPQGHGGAFYVPGTLQADSLAITEAPLDALSLVLCGLPTVVATCGTAWPAWLPRACAFRRVLLATDADLAGDAAAERLYVALTALGARCQRLRPFEGKDWNELLQRLGPEAVAASLPIE